jgi:enamine deaminase RidA (YjgF/YER057c/UK114 family)
MKHSICWTLVGAVLAVAVLNQAAATANSQEEKMKTYNPATVHLPPSAYSHAIEVSPNARWLYLAGQGGFRLDGTRPEGIEAQAEQSWRNILSILKAADMGPQNIVRVTTYTTNASFRDAIQAARVRALGAHRPAATFLVVSAFALPDMLIEIDIVAAKE